MKYRQKLCMAMIAAAIAGMVGASSALAVPYTWTPGQIQALADATAGFSGGQSLSTVNSITNIPLGIQLDVTFKVGQNTDPFGADFGQTFARIALVAGNGFPGLDLSAFDSSVVNVTTTTDITPQPFLQTDFTENGGSIDDGDANPGEAFSFYFWENSVGVATGGPTPAPFNFLAANEFGAWDQPNPTAVKGTNAIRQWGFQIGKFSGIAFGQPVTATIKIEGKFAVPEPATATLGSLLLVGLAGFARRRAS